MRSGQGPAFSYRDKSDGFSYVRVLVVVYGEKPIGLGDGVWLGSA